MKQCFMATIWLLLICSICSAANTPITNQMLVEQQRYENFRLSPTGTNLAYAYKLHDKQTVIVKQINNGQASTIPLPANLSLLWAHWNNAGDLLYLFCQDSQGELLVYSWDQARQALAMPLDKKWLQSVNLGTKHNFFAFTIQRFLDEETNKLVDFNPNDGSLHPVQNRKSYLPAYWKGHPAEFKLTSWGGKNRWVLNNTIAFNLTGMDNLMGTNLISASPDLRRAWFLSSVDRDKLALVSIDLKTGAVSEIASRDADIRQVLLHPVNKSPVGFTWGRERNHFELIDKSYQTDVNYIRRAMRGEFSIIDIAASNQFMLIEKYGAVSTWFRYDRKAKTLTNIPLSTTTIDADLHPTESYRFKARDGLELSVFLTPPAKGTCASAQCPMIFSLHGGPATRDYSTPDMERNWLASRGYFVAHLNYRGSSGYGKHFQNLDIGNWGSSMQEDVEDALRFILKKNLKLRPIKSALKAEVLVAECC